MDRTGEKALRPTTLAGLFVVLSTLGCDAPEEGTPGIADGWRYQVVTRAISSGSMGQRKVRLRADATGELHLATLSSGILYGRLAPGAETWRLEQIAETTSVSHWLGLGVTPAGSAHFVYYDDQSLSLRYVRPLPSGWEVEEIDDGSSLGHEGTPDVGHYCDIAMGPEDTPHVSYHDNSGGSGPDAFTLRYAYRETFSGWQRETIRRRTLGSVGEWTAIAVDGVARVHILYQDADDSSLEKLNIASKVGGVWSDETLDDSGDTGHETSIALDPDGSPHAAYLRPASLQHVFYDAPNFAWVRATVSELDGAAKTALTVDAAGRAHIAYCAGIGHPMIKYAHFDGARWEIVEVDTGVGRGGPYGCGSVAIALDDRGRPHILYANQAALEIPESAALHHVWREP